VAATELLEFVGIGTGSTRRKNLPYGDQRRLEIARALATKSEAAAAGRAGRRNEPGEKCPCRA